MKAGALNAAGLLRFVEPALLASIQKKSEQYLFLKRTGQALTRGSSMLFQSRFSHSAQSTASSPALNLQREILGLLFPVIPGDTSKSVQTNAQKYLEM
jgi:hypothetical protein